MTDRAPDLDLHEYIHEPDKARAIIDACITESLKNGHTLVRVVHGKGKGDFRALIQSHLDKHPDVAGYVLCDPFHGGSGATWMHLGEEKPDTEDVERKDTRPVWRWLVYLAFLIAAFAVFDQPWIRGLMIVFIAWYELRSATRQYSETEDETEDESSGSDG